MYPPLARTSCERHTQLKIETAPQIVHFPPTDGRLGKLKYQKNPLLFEPCDNRGYACVAVRPGAPGAAHP